MPIGLEDLQCRKCGEPLVRSSCGSCPLGCPKCDGLPVWMPPSYLKEALNAEYRARRFKVIIVTLPDGSTGVEEREYTEEEKNEPWA